MYPLALSGTRLGAPDRIIVRGPETGKRQGMHPLACSGTRRRARGFSMLEVLISLAIMAFGLLGLVGMQAVAQKAELDSYQRAQALVILSDIIDRINTNRNAATCYSITTDTTNGTPYLGSTAGGSHYSVGSFSCPAAATNPDGVVRAQLDLTAIDQMLQGYAEQLSGGQVGAMIGARACIAFNTASQAYTVAVAWQGSGPTFSPAGWTSAPAVAANCALGLYGTDTQRRVVWNSIVVAALK
jgi:type IV pilus assembly protein PilV